MVEGCASLDAFERIGKPKPPGAAPTWFTRFRTLRLRAADRGTPFSFR
jgi:hypothetical protein